MGAETSFVPLGKNKSISHVQISHQILIVIRGSRKVGKTSLLRAMNAKPFDPLYKPTPIMQATEILWKPFSYPDTIMKITVWDVVDHALKVQNQMPKQIELPDATTVDTYSRSNGIVILYDPRNDDSAEYAKKICANTIAFLFIIVLNWKQAKCFLIDEWLNQLWDKFILRNIT